MDEVIQAECKHFLLHRIAEGVFAVVAKEGGAL